MTFHTSRFGGALVSQTSKFMSGYTQMGDVVGYSLIPTIASTACTFIALAPAVPAYAAALAAMLVIYVIVATRMYQRILPLSAATAKAQNRLSGVLSDAVTNILAVKTCGREDFEKELSTRRTSRPCGPRAAPCAPPCSAASPRAASSP